MPKAGQGAFMYRIERHLVSAVVSATILANPLAAQAGGMSTTGTPAGNHGSSQTMTGPGCKQSNSTDHKMGSHTAPNDNNVSIYKPTSTITNVNVYSPTTVNNNISVYKPTDITNNVNINNPVTVDNNISVYKPISIDKNFNITTNIDASKNITINKPVSITNNIDASKNIDITKNIDDSKTIDDSKNINISTNIVINKGGSDTDATAIAAAIAEASANAAAIANAFANSSSNSNASATVNFSGSSNSSGFSTSESAATSSAGSSATFFSSTMAPEAPAAFAGGDVGNLSVEVAAAPVAAQQCTIQEATVVKAIHAICVSDNGHEFPASHMLGDTWINSSYEGEVARCIPGSHLKIVMGKVTQSAEGMATSYSSGQVLQCGVHEALRHYKDGVLKCAPAVPVPDCTERTNLRKFGTGDMFFTYSTRVCLETHQEYGAQASSDNFGRQSSLRDGRTAY
jgi:hypothetical protein